jgi:hypothetical protein
MSILIAGGPLLERGVSLVELPQIAIVFLDEPMRRDDGLAFQPVIIFSCKSRPRRGGGADNSASISTAA